MKRILITAAFAMGMSVASVQAHLVDLGELKLSAVIGNPTDEANWIENHLSLTDQLSYLEKWNYAATGVGSFEGQGVAPNSGPANYVVSPTSQGPTADISWDLSGTSYQAAYVLVKDGVNNLGGGDKEFLYHLYGVSSDQATIGGPDNVIVNGLSGVGDKNISHIAWYGVTRSSGTDVPDGGTTAALLGLGLLGVGFVARRKA